MQNLPAFDPQYDDVIVKSASVFTSEVGLTDTIFRTSYLIETKPTTSAFGISPALPSGLLISDGCA